jgi:phosphate transport system substrate-binding protein
MALVENNAGNYVAPTLKNSLAALEGVALPDNLRLWIPDPKGKEAYPIVTYTWILCYRKYANPRAAQTLKTVLRYCLTEGQQYSQQLGYLPLPERVVERCLKAVDEIGP